MSLVAFKAFKAQSPKLLWSYHEGFQLLALLKPNKPKNKQNLEKSVWTELRKVAQGLTVCFFKQTSNDKKQWISSSAQFPCLVCSVSETLKVATGPAVPASLGTSRNVSPTASRSAFSPSFQEIHRHTTVWEALPQAQQSVLSSITPSQMKALFLVYSYLLFFTWLLLSAKGPFPPPAPPAPTPGLLLLYHLRKCVKIKGKNPSPRAEQWFQGKSSNSKQQDIHKLLQKVKRTLKNESAC